MLHGVALSLGQPVALAAVELLEVPASLSCQVAAELQLCIPGFWIAPPILVLSMDFL